MFNSQVLKFMTVGLVSNVALYLSYLLITTLGVGHKTAMTVLYATGVCMTFAFNRRWTFGHEGRVSRAFIEYVALYAVGYVFNLAVLYLCVDYLGYNHRLIQGLMIVALAVFFFLSQKFLVFRRP